MVFTSRAAVLCRADEVFERVGEAERGAQRRVGLHRVHELRGPKVDQLEPPFGGQQHVLRLQEAGGGRREAQKAAARALLQRVGGAP